MKNLTVILWLITSKILAKSLAVMLSCENDCPNYPNVIQDLETCKCVCIVERECILEKQSFNSQFCECLCDLEPNGTRNCISPKYWDERSCSCVCPNIQCIDKYTLSQDCDCECPLTEKSCTKYQKFNEDECECFCENYAAIKRCEERGAFYRWNSTTCFCDSLIMLMLYDPASVLPGVAGRGGEGGGMIVNQYQQMGGAAGNGLAQLFGVGGPR